MTFQHHQAIFAAYIRNPEKNAMPANVKPERMAMYRELFFNNIDGFLTSTFPVLHRLLSLENWTHLVHDFFENHICKTPHFSEIPEEFLTYLQNERDNQNDLPFLFELAHYEWIEMALSISHEKVEAQSIENVTRAKLKLSPVACVLVYQFPVQKICAEFIPQQSEQPTFLTVYRNEDDIVQFLEITPLTFQLLQLVENSPEKMAKAYFLELQRFAPHISMEILEEKGFEMVTDFVKRGVLIAA